MMTKKSYFLIRKRFLMKAWLRALVGKEITVVVGFQQLAGTLLEKNGGYYLEMPRENWAFDPDSVTAIKF